MYWTVPTPKFSLDNPSLSCRALFDVWIDNVVLFTVNINTWLGRSSNASTMGVLEPAYMTFDADDGTYQGYMMQGSVEELHGLINFVFYCSQSHKETFM